MITQTISRVAYFALTGGRQCWYTYEYELRARETGLLTRTCYVRECATAV